MFKKYLTLIKIGIVGFLNLGIDFFVFTFLSYCGFPYLAAQSLSYCCGLVNSYALNRMWAIQVKKSQSEFIKFTGVNLITLVFASGLLFFFFQVTGWPLFLSKLVATSIGAIINYIGAHFFVFQVTEMERENM
ncbi:putative flippase GtrA [Pullulanibacillus pueri]|uniref:GtrA/DPMS transmembrane domain-containing protein n=1 Tax=Pullulanibacillus pueri TaxID=1437324 RepID=A0A8J2ZU59_9BACL|nr:GtrA family protein [Pullulanibacillus pueri]MBM7681312.1 putative flippase GtrA [Pullulanibacillus pueri]GGH77635.1 hypothetical protein GCM10007096_09820 [Pullulanibacillus pueri]